MIQKNKNKIKENMITPKKVFLNRRKIITGIGMLGFAGAGGLLVKDRQKTEYIPRESYYIPENPYAINTDALTDINSITKHNNFYEFGFAKSDPFDHANSLTTDPWTLEVAGLVEKPGVFDLSKLKKENPIEERIYKFRCVEGWSMVVPWEGFQLSTLLSKVGVMSKAKYVAFETLYRPEEMKEQHSSTVLEWPYKEGLRIDEAMNPLTLLATGLYGEDMPKQNGAPIRLIVPWKYGFKSIKSIVKITLTEKQPITTWNVLSPDEYGFYANVNPEVDHPRWSQQSERRLGGGAFSKRMETLKFNEYEEDVSHLYKGMDLKLLF